MEIPHSEWQAIIYTTVQAAVVALIFMRRIRFSSYAANQASGDSGPQMQAAAVEIDLIPVRRASEGIGDLGAIMDRGLGPADVLCVCLWMLACA